jgi:hypothetical protein
MYAYRQLSPGLPGHRSLIAVVDPSALLTENVTYSTLTATASKHCCPTRCLRVFKELWTLCNANKTFRPVEICDPAREQPYMQGRHTTSALLRDPPITQVNTRRR